MREDSRGEGVIKGETSRFDYSSDASPGVLLVRVAGTFNIPSLFDFTLNRKTMG